MASDTSTEIGASTLSRILKFAVVGASGVFVNLAVFHLGLWMLSGSSASSDVRVLIANAIGIVVSIFTNFLLNDQWTWGDRLKGARRRDWFSRVAKYYVSASGAAAVQLTVTSLSFSLLFDSAIDMRLFGLDVDATFALLTGIACGMFINFAASHLWAFRDTESS